MCWARSRGLSLPSLRSSTSSCPTRSRPAPTAGWRSSPSSRRSAKRMSKSCSKWWNRRTEISDKTIDSDREKNPNRATNSDRTQNSDKITNSNKKATLIKEGKMGFVETQDSDPASNRPISEAFQNWALSSDCPSYRSRPRPSPPRCPCPPSTRTTTRSTTTMSTRKTGSCNFYPKNRPEKAWLGFTRIASSQKSGSYHLLLLLLHFRLFKSSATSSTLKISSSFRLLPFLTSAIWRPQRCSRWNRVIDFRTKMIGFRTNLTQPEEAERVGTKFLDYLFT